MNLKLFIDIDNRKLVKSKTSDFPVNLATLFREDWIDLEVTLCEPSGTITSPLNVVDVSSLSIKVAIGNPDVDPEAYQDTFTRDTTNNKFTGTLNINTTEMVAAFTAASGETIDRYFEIEVEGTSNHFHTVLQQAITLHKDVITNTLVAPQDVTSGSAFANSFAATTENSVTIEHTKTGDSNYAHIIGMSGLSSLTASKFLQVKSDATGFELGDGSVGPAGPTGPAGSQGLQGYQGQSGADGADADSFSTIEGDSGSTTADSTSDTLTVSGGEGIDTSVSGDTLTVAGEDASDTNKGIAKFVAADFTVSNGEVSLDAVAISNGGTGATSKEDGMDALSPLSAAGDILTHDGSNNTRLAKGSANQVLTMNAAGTAVEWDDESAGGTTYTAGDGLDLTSTEFSADLKANGGLVIESTELAVDLAASSITGTLAVGDGGTGATTLNNLITLGTHTTGDYVATVTGGTGIASTGATSGETIAHSLSLDVNELTDVGTTTFGATTFGAGDYIAVADASDSNNPKKVKLPVELGMAASDETSDLATGTAKLTFRMPHAMTLTEVRANVNTAPVGSTLIVDINEGGTTILSTKLSIDASEKTSTTAAAAAVISDTALADDAELTIDIDQIGSSTAGKGLKIWLIGYR